jgi:DNA-binding transcriptional MerR regulator
MEPRWKIAELAEVVGKTLASVGHAEQPSARVRDVPDLRTIRYYTTLGLVDRPSEMRGRTAFYGWRHVWQLLAIKQLQASGLTLVEVQQRLAGADDRTLKKLARVPDRLVRAEAAGEQRCAPIPRLAASERTSFWADTPAAATTGASGPLVGQSPAVRSALHIKLGDGVTLVLEGVEPRVCNRDKLAAIERAARGLIKEVHRLVADSSSVGSAVPPSSPMAPHDELPAEVAPPPGRAERSPS